MSFPLSRFVAFIVLSLIVATIAHESIHAMFALARNKAVKDEVCFLGYSGNTISGSAFAWVVIDDENFENENYIVEEIIANIFSCYVLFFMMMLLIASDIKFEEEREKEVLKFFAKKIK